MIRATLVIILALAIATSASASSGVTLTPGRIVVESCSEGATMPIINWSMKGWTQVVTLHKIGDCRLAGTFDATTPGVYCTGIGDIDGADWTPDECVTVKPAATVRERFRNVFRYRYAP